MVTYTEVSVWKVSVFLIVILLSVIISQLSMWQDSGSSFELSIIHFSDFHSRFHQITTAGGLCYDYKTDKCVGGVARIATVAKRLKQIRPNAILLNAGDFMQGSLHYEIHRSEIISNFMNKLPHDVITIGNHDFDDGITGLVSLVKSLEAPVVLANVDCAEEPLLENVFKNSTIIRKGDRDIGVIGVIYSETDKLSTYTGKLKFLNEVETVNEEAKKLKARGVNIIIVLSHCGIDHDKVMAENCPDIDIIVGGHSHVLLYNGKPPSKEVAHDKYPIVVKQSSGRKVLIVHSGPFTKYIGDIKVTFDEYDEAVSWEGNPIYLDKNIEQDLSILRELEPWRDEVDRIGKQFVRETLVFLSGSCSKGECNLANLITDAMVDRYSDKASISLASALFIQNSIPRGAILYEDLYAALPYNDTWDVIELKGSDLLEVIEGNIISRPGQKPKFNPFMLHWSGLKVVYDLSELDSKVANIQTRCHKCSDGKFQDLDPNKWYEVVVPTYLLTASFPTISKRHRNHVAGNTRDIDNMIMYLQKIKVVNVTKDSRMTFR